MHAGPEANDFNISTSYTSITLRWTVPEALQYYSVVQGYNITYTEKEAGDGSKAAVPLDQLEASAVHGIAYLHASQWPVLAVIARTE